MIQKMTKNLRKRLRRLHTIHLYETFQSPQNFSPPGLTHCFTTHCGEGLGKADIGKPPGSIHRRKTILPSDSLFPDFGNILSRLWKACFHLLEAKHHPTDIKTSSNESQNIIKCKPKHYQTKTKTSSNANQNIIKRRPKHHQMQTKTS